MPNSGKSRDSSGGGGSSYSSLPAAPDDLDEFEDGATTSASSSLSSNASSSSSSFASTQLAAWDDADALPHLHQPSRPVIHYSLGDGTAAAASASSSHESTRGLPRSAVVDAIMRAGEEEDGGDHFFDDAEDDIERLLSSNAVASSSTTSKASGTYGGSSKAASGSPSARRGPASPAASRSSMAPMSVSIDDYDYDYAYSTRGSSSSSGGRFGRAWQESTRSRLVQAVRAAVEAETGSWMAYAVGWTAMLLAIMSSAATTPMFKYLEESGVRPGLAACWRSQAMSIFLLPIAALEAVTTGQYIKAWERRPDLDYQIYVHVCFAGLGWAASLLFYINGLQLTTAVRASLITNMHPLIMVLYMFVRRQPLHRLDWAGVLVAFAGVLIMALEKMAMSGGAAHDTHSSSSPVLELCGMLMCLIAATSDCFVIINRKMIKKYVPLMQYTCVTALFVLVACAAFSIAFEGTDVFCYDRDDCLFGWAGADWIKPMATFGFVNGVVCQAGFNFAMQYIDPLLFSSLLLLGVPLTGLLAWLAGVQSVPDAGTWVGGAVILLGIALVTYSEHAKNQQYKGYNPQPLQQGSGHGHDAVSTDSSHSGRRGGSSHGSSHGSGGSSHGGGGGGGGGARYSSSNSNSSESRFEYHLPEVDADVDNEDFGFLLATDTHSQTKTPVVGLRSAVTL